MPGFPAAEVRKHGQGQSPGEQDAQQDASVPPVAPPQVRLLLDAPQPLEAELLHDAGSAPHHAGLKSDHRAEVGTDRNRETLVVVPEPSLALGRAQRNGEEIRAAGVDGGDEIAAAEVGQ